MAGTFLCDDLQQQIESGQVVAIVGAGVSVGATNNHAVASWQGLLYHGVDYCRELPTTSVTDAMAQLLHAQIDAGDLDLMLARGPLISPPSVFPALAPSHGNAPPTMTPPARCHGSGAGHVRAHHGAVLHRLGPSSSRTDRGGRRAPPARRCRQKEGWQSIGRGDLVAEVKPEESVGNNLTAHALCRLNCSTAQPTAAVSVFWSLHTLALVIAWASTLGTDHGIA